MSGHVALRHMVHLDVGVLGEIKRRQVIEENEKEKEKHTNKKRGPGSESSANTTKVGTGILFYSVKLEPTENQCFLCITTVGPRRF